MYLITGCAGFIGFSTAIKLLKEGKKVLGVDNLNNYYDQKLKLNRLKNLKTYKKFKFYKINICDKKRIFKVFNISWYRWNNYIQDIFINSFRR